MKSILKGLAVFLFVIILSGCGTKTEERVVTCTLEQNNVAYGYELRAEYNIYTDGTIVNRVETTEVATSDNQEILDYLENYNNTLYTNMNDAYGGYEFSSTNENNTLTAVTKIDYKKLDREKLVEDQPSMKNYMNDDNMLTLDGIKSMYEQMGATCAD